jgi:hypothetical protein
MDVRFQADRRHSLASFALGQFMRKVTMFIAYGDGRLLNAHETSVGTALREHVYFLVNPRSVAHDHVDKVTFGVAVSGGKLIKDDELSMIERFPKTENAFKKGRALNPFAVNALTEGRIEVPIHGFLSGQLGVEQVGDCLFDR